MTNSGLCTSEQAIHRAVRQLERDGIPIITYRNAKTGVQTVQNKIDVAVRRHVRTQIAQDSGRMTMGRLEGLDIALVEVSSHCGARPSHQAWEGRVYSLHGDVTIEGTRYADFRSATGYLSVDGLLGANCRHSFGPYRHGAPRAYHPDPKHPSGLSNDEVDELTQKQRYCEQRIREAKRELRGAQQIYEKERSIPSLAAVERSRAQLRDRQAAIRELIEEANAKCKPGTRVLTRKPNREWAGDMPKTKVPARTKHGAERMTERRISDSQAADAIIKPLHKEPVKVDDKGRPEQKYIGFSSTVILNPETNEIITAYPTKARFRKKYGTE